MTTTRIGMGLVGPGFVGAHHIDAVRRLGFVDVVAVAASSEASARRKADALGVPKAYGSYEALVADPDVHVVHNTTPNYLHVPGDPGRARARQARHLGQAAGDDRRRGATRCATRATRGRRRPRRDVQLPRQPAGAAGARDDRRRRARRACISSTARTCRTGCSKPTDFSWRLEPEKGGESSAVGDIGSHWCDLVQHVTGRRIVEVLADLTTVVATRLKPAASTRGVRARRRRRAASRSRVQQRGSRDRSCVRFDGGAKGSVSVGQVCAGHKNDLWFEVNGRRGVAALAAGAAERAVDRPPRRRQRRAAEGSVAARAGGARAYAHLPGGHQEGWADAFCNVMRDIYGFIAAGERPADRDAAGVRHVRRRVSCGVRRRRHSGEPRARRRLDRRSAAALAGDAR